jgi:hypothetical protein
LYKPGKEIVMADALSLVQIKMLCPLPTNDLWKEVRKGYKESPLGNFIKAMEEKEEPTNKYTINDGLLYYRMDEYSP